jgi:8-oxo-dGTP pyrophosphatase MutT (NUDIX family)
MHPTARLGVGVVAINLFGKVLVLRRIDHGTDGWQMPESEISRGESPRDAVQRELREEICADATEILAESQSWRSHDVSEAGLAKNLIADHGQRERQKWFLVLCTGQDANIRLRSDKPVFDAWRWVSPEEVHAVAVPAKRQLYRDILEEFAPAIGNFMMLISALETPGEIALPSRKRPGLGHPEEVEVDAGPLEITDGEVNFIQGFVHDGSIGAECGLQLVRYWGYCERHAWVSLAVEMSLLHGFCSRSATLYTDVLRQGIAALSPEYHRRPRAVAKALKESGTCMICSANPRGRGLLTVAELAKAKDVSSLRSLAEGSAQFWASDCCPHCINGATHGHLCRRHLIEALDIGTPSNLDADHRHLVNVLARLENFAWSFSWDFRGIDGPEDRAALISAIGWCSGWSSLGAIIPFGQPSSAPQLGSVG